MWWKSSPSSRDREVLLRRLFAVHAYDDDGAYFLLPTNRIGFGWISAPLSGGGERAASALNQFLALRWPTGTVLQTCLIATPDIEDVLDGFLAIRERPSSAMLAEIATERVAYLRHATYDRIDTISDMRVRSVRIVWTVHYPIADVIPTEEDLRAYRELSDMATQTLRSAGIAPQRLTAELYLRVLRTYLLHGSYASWRGRTRLDVHADQLLCHQVLDPDTSLEVDEDGLWIDSGDTISRVRTLGLKDLPPATYFGQALTYLGDILTGTRGIPGTVLISASVHYPPQDRERARRERDLLWSRYQAGGRLSRYIKSFAERAQDLDQFMSYVSDGDRIVDVHFGIALLTQGHLRDDTEHRSNGAVANAVTYMRERGYIMLPDRYFTLPLFAHLLPFGSEAEMRAVLMRWRTMTSRQAAVLLPVMAAWSGTGTPLTLFLTRDGQPMPVSPYDSPSNYNLLIAGQSGSGKSFAVQELITHFLACGGIVRSIDIGRSQAHLAELIGGRIIHWDDTTDISINPFCTVADWDDDADLLASILAVMAAPRDGLNDWQLQALKAAMRDTWEQYGREMTVDAIIERLRSARDPREHDLATMLYSFSSRGEYGRYFSGRNDLDLSLPYIVLELEGLTGRPHLQRVVMLLLMWRLQQEMYLGDRAQKKLLVLDECHAHLDSEQIVPAIVQFWRRVRKANGVACAITQSISDWFLTPAALAIYENSAMRWLFSQTAESIEHARREGRLEIGDAGLALLRTVRTVPGQYSEALITTAEGAFGVGRLVVPPGARYLYSSRAEDVAAIRQLRAAGYSLADAIAHLTNQGGIRRVA